MRFGQTFTFRGLWFSGKIRGFSLMEVIITVAVVAILTLAVLSSLIFSIYFQSHQQERATAVLAAEQEIENLRTRVFQDLTPSTRQVCVNNNRTPGVTADDTTGELAVALRKKDGSYLAAGERPSTIDRLIAEVSVTWHPRGRGSSQLMSESLMVILVP